MRVVVSFHVCGIIQGCKSSVIPHEYARYIYIYIYQSIVSLVQNCVCKSVCTVSFTEFCKGTFK